MTVAPRLLRGLGVLCGLCGEILFASFFCPL